MDVYFVGIIIKKLTMKELMSNDFSIKNSKLYVNNNKMGNKPGMLLIWAEWCPHCHSFLPTFKELSKKLGKDFVCASIEHGQFKDNRSLSSSLDFKYFPTLKFFDQSGMIMKTYDGERNMSSILKEICQVYHHCIMYH